LSYPGSNDRRLEQACAKYVLMNLVPGFCFRAEEEGATYLALTVTMRHFGRKRSSSDAVPMNSPAPTAPTSPIDWHIKRELATLHPRAKDQRALAASSSAVALSIGFPSCGHLDSASNEPGPSGESGWKTAYGAARIAVEVAKESSDMFLPLKAVLGALSVLIKNHDVGHPNYPTLFLTDAFT
jgi:hypothetical protein